MEFLARHATALWERHGVVTTDVEILPGDKGELAIDWRTGRRELLLTFPEGPLKEASFYGDNGNEKHKIMGNLDPATVTLWLVSWLAE